MMWTIGGPRCPRSSFSSVHGFLLPCRGCVACKEHSFSTVSKARLTFTWRSKRIPTCSRFRNGFAKELIRASDWELKCSFSPCTDVTACERRGWAQTEKKKLVPRAHAAAAVLERGGGTRLDVPPKSKAYYRSTARCKTRRPARRPPMDSHAAGRPPARPCAPHPDPPQLLERTRRHAGHGNPNPIADRATALLFPEVATDWPV
jgi:hypothetical protein